MAMQTLRAWVGNEKSESDTTGTSQLSLATLSELSHVKLENKWNPVFLPPLFTFIYYYPLSQKRNGQNISNEAEFSGYLQSAWKQEEEGFIGLYYQAGNLPSLSIWTCF